jgi:sugar O-acyltransferase (sialic acid O-acetyltransferase NeuD family)
MAKRDIIVVGTGGHARVVSAVIDSLKTYRVVGFLDRKRVDRNERILGIPVIGLWTDLLKIRRSGVREAALALGDNEERSEMFDKLLQMGYRLPALVHKQAFVEKGAWIGEGAVVCAGSCVAVLARLGRGAILNTGAVLDHESQVDDFAHVAPGSLVAGRVSIGEGTFVGIGSSIKDQVKIGRWSVIGAGSVVVSDIPDRVTAYGAPARVKVNK